MGYSGWIYDRLHHNEERVDIVFTGSSKTINAVNCQWLDDGLAERGVDNTSANLGFCRLGRNMHYTIIKEAIETKHPHAIIIEVSEKENRDGHMDFAYVADAVDIWSPVLVFNDNLFQDIGKATAVRFEAMKQKLLGKYIPPPVHKTTYGYVPDSSLADVQSLLDIKAGKVNNWKYSKGISRWFYNQQAFNNIDRIKKLADKNGCDLYFLYLPGFGSIPQPEENEFYKSRGTLLIPPAEILNNPHYYKDELHMNDYGAKALSKWLAGELPQ